jgi:hypothetical protein
LRVYRGVRSLCCLIVLLAAAAAAPGATAPARGLEDAIAARSLLGADAWARLVRIDSSRPSSVLRRGPYPRTVYALVFELSGILWFYTDVDGTQSLSLTRGTVARDEADPGPLFRSIDPGFTSWSWVDAPSLPRNLSARPRNACFVESVAALNRRIASGGEAASPSLLSYYVDTPQGRLGHTVLLFGTSAGLSAIDSDDSSRTVLLPADLGADPRAVSAYLRGGPVAAARTIPIVCPRPTPREWASLPSPRSPAG